MTVCWMWHFRVNNHSRIIGFTTFFISESCTFIKCYNITAPRGSWAWIWTLWSGNVRLVVQIRSHFIIMFYVHYVSGVKLPLAMNQKPDYMEIESRQDPGLVFCVSSGNTIRLPLYNYKVTWWLDYNLFEMWPASQESERGPRTATASISTSPPLREKEDWRHWRHERGAMWVTGIPEQNIVQQEDTSPYSHAALRGSAPF